ncbi:YceI family protein [Ferruginibacter sp.]
MESIDNDYKKWKEHLKYPYFFDLGKYPQIIFISGTF